MQSKQKATRREGCARILKVPLLRSSAAAAIVALAGSAYAAAPEGAQTLISRAEALLKVGNAQAAYGLLAPVELQNAGNFRFDYLLGIAALDTEHTSGAIFALERAVADEPNNSLAHAELGRAYLEAGEIASARHELQVARLGSVPPEAAATIDRVLGSIEDAQVPARSRTVRGYIDMAVGHDSNLNSATANGQFALPAFGGIVFTLDPANQRRPSPFMALGGGGDMQIGLTRDWSLVGSINGRGTFNSHDHDLRQQQMDASFGAAWSRPEDTVTATLQTSTFWLDADRYRSANGVSAQWQHALPEAAQVSGFAQWSQLKYPDQPERNSDRTVLGVGYAKAFASSSAGRAQGATTVAYGSVYGARENARTSGFENFGHDAIGVRTGIEYQEGQRSWFASAQYEQRRYGGPEPFFDATRLDKQSDLSIGLRYAFAPSWRITPQISTTRNASNVALYEYRRTVYQLILRREFN